MRPHDDVARRIAADQRSLVTRQELLAAGLSPDGAYRRVNSGSWTRRQAGVYQLDVRSQTWHDQLLTAVLAAGSEVLASHRAALMLWQLDGISQAPVEITVPYTHGPVPTGTIVHRSRRAPQPTTRFGIPTTVIERTLLDVCGILSSLIATKAIESALRQRLTTVERLHDFLKTAGGRGVKGTRRCRNILNQRMYDVATDSGAETEALYFIRRYDVPEPVLQHKVKTSMGTIRPDFYWPDIQKAVEIDGLDAHDSADKLDHDLRRQNALLNLGIELRRFSARRIRREPEEVMAEIKQFLSKKPVL